MRVACLLESKNFAHMHWYRYLWRKKIAAAVAADVEHEHGVLLSF